MLEKCCDKPSINSHKNFTGRSMWCSRCGHIVRNVSGAYFDLAMTWNESCDKELSCMEIVSM